MIRPHSIWNVRHIDKDGKVLWEDKEVHNMFHDEGELVMVTSLFAQAYSTYGVTPISNWAMYIGLDNRSSLAEANTLASLTGEPSGFGYARQILACNQDGTSGKDFVITQPAAAYQAASKTVTFTASGGAWSAVQNCFLCTHPTATTSGQYTRLLCSLALSTIRTLQNGDSLQVSMNIAISE